MFSTVNHLKKRTPDNGTDRESYLSLLVDEYINTSSFDAKCQVLANLANFAYDPINYCFIRDVGVLDIFLYVLKNESDSKLLHYACAGICNLSIDPLNIEYILNYGILSLLSALLKNSHVDLVASAVTVCIQIHNTLNKPELFNTEVIHQMSILKGNENKIIANLANIFLEDVNKTDQQ